MINVPLSIHGLKVHYHMCLKKMVVIYMWEKIGRSISNRSQRFIITKLIQKRNMVGVFVMNANIFIIVTGDTMTLGNGMWIAF